MTETVTPQVTTEDVKQAILALLRENNVELKSVLEDLAIKIKDSATPKLKKTKAAKTKDGGITIVEGSRMPYSEMPFWKANPHLKPIDFKAQGYGMTQEAFKNLQDFFQEPGNEIKDEWFDMLD